ncbi:Calcium-dependent lipid-binding (CaLB domain) family protein [Rhynchospora pubera]|uniref:Calcium-dependent lipid-binding (CaLB domain) family protein n=1 Tax=Rhynchospora pubera TaxID=906938 RepID=A0AAV8AUD8_9POAL|nr:Calcium-dependent lipid-binding (CaLB domain) family protein [Rhynchospora pubera]KAJ4806018.1 Calcium-dependent lipid-binding (CaLB domain) family protein [Rhynchospora pubera]
MQVEITIVSGRTLKNVNWQHGTLKPYAVLWIDSGPKCTSKVDTVHDEDPIWDEKISITLPPTSRPDTAVLYMDIVHANPLPGTKPLVGSAQLPLRDVLNEARSGKVPRSLKLKRPSGRPHGKLEIKIGVNDHPMNYSQVGPQGQPAYYGYGGPPPQQHQYPYGAPAAPPAGYPSAYGYGAPRPPVPVHGSPRASTAQTSNRGMDANTKLAVGVATKLFGETFKSVFN